MAKKKIYQLELKKLRYNYDQIKALQGLSFRLEKGERVGIIGASGSGKSTLLKILAGRFNPLSGEVLFQNQALKDVRNERLGNFAKISLMDQDFNLIPDISADANILRFARHLNPSAAKRYLGKVHRSFHMQSFKEKKVRFLSGGQKQRVALACALVADAELWLLDEPFSQLDYILKQELMTFVEKLSRNKSLIIVGHEPSDLMAICDRLIVMNSGKIVQDAPVDEIYHHPKNEYVARLSGLVNLIDADLAALLDTNERYLRPSHFKVQKGSTWQLERIYYYGYGRMGSFRSGQIGESLEVQLGNEQHYQTDAFYDLQIKKPQA